MPTHLPAIEQILERDRLAIGAGLACVTTVSWAYLIQDTRTMDCMAMMASLSGPQQRAWSLIEVWWLFVMWAVMMVAMMAPSVAPTALTFAAVSRRRRQQNRPFVSTSVFLGGYLAVWTLFSAVAAAGQWVLHTTALLSSSMVLLSPAASGGLLILAGIFQFTPLKRACLVHCQSPLTFLMTEWREGALGTLLMGARHGAFCVGCCWLLMAVLFAVGVMHLGWVALISAVVLIEKIAPARGWVSRISGMLLVAWGIRVLSSALHTRL
ncbi:MAG: DUF2182 domain-containing protein [Candidatus Omnitrophica bacterium]|nr:DUF2182 domain-containing protein [Candidatus Omnitrophota bacterium]